MALVLSIRADVWNNGVYLVAQPLTHAIPAPLLLLLLLLMHYSPPDLLLPPWWMGPWSKTTPAGDRSEQSSEEQWSEQSSEEWSDQWSAEWFWWSRWWVHHKGQKVDINWSGKSGDNFRKMYCMENILMEDITNLLIIVCRDSIHVEEHLTYPSPLHLNWPLNHTVYQYQ